MLLINSIVLRILFESFVFYNVENEKIKNKSKIQIQNSFADDVLFQIIIKLTNKKKKVNNKKLRAKQRST